MKKSSYFIISGAAIGIITSVIVLMPTKDDPQSTLINSSSVQTTDKHSPDKNSVVTGQNISNESLADMEMRQSQSPDMAMMGMQNDAAMDQSQDTMGAQNDLAIPASQTAKVELSTLPDALKDTPPVKPAAPAIPPTAEQVEQFKYMDEMISSAANNHSIQLTDLIQQSSSLTIEQRGQLTQKALDMINRGELKVEQFSEKPPGS